jgi:hypothetical protein
MATSTATVGTAPVLVFAPQANAQNFIITNTSPVTVYLGQTGVTSATGFPLAPNQEISLPSVAQSIYAVSGAGAVKAPTSVTSGSVVATGTALPVASGGASYTNGMVVVVQDGNSTEVVTVGAGSTGTSVVVSALAFDHGTGVTFGQLSASNNGAVRVVSGV